MAEFCLEFEGIVEESITCAEMALKLDKAISESPRRHYDENICRDSTACLPCKKASLVLLGRCANDPDMRPVLELMHFSNALRDEGVEGKED